jgi:hypothetical protein
MRNWSNSAAGPIYRFQAPIALFWELFAKKYWGWIREIGWNRKANPETAIGQRGILRRRFRLWLPDQSDIRRSRLFDSNDTIGIAMDRRENPTLKPLSIEPELTS